MPRPRRRGSRGGRVGQRGSRGHPGLTRGGGSIGASQRNAVAFGAKEIITALHPKYRHKKLPKVDDDLKNINSLNGNCSIIGREGPKAPAPGSGLQERHVRTSHLQDRQQYPCRECGVVFRKQNNLLKHAQSSGHNKVILEFSKNSCIPAKEEKNSVEEGGQRKIYKPKFHIQNLYKPEESGNVNLEKCGKISGAGGVSPSSTTSGSIVSSLSTSSTQDVLTWSVPSSNSALNMVVPAAISNAAEKSVIPEVQVHPSATYPSTLKLVPGIQITKPSPSPKSVAVTASSSQSASWSAGKAGLRIEIPHTSALSCNSNSTGTSTPHTPLSAKSLRSPEAITQHISKIISENEAIVETLNPVWSKRYLRQASGGSTSSTDSDRGFYPIRPKLDPDSAVSKSGLASIREKYQTPCLDLRKVSLQAPYIWGDTKLIISTESPRIVDHGFPSFTMAKILGHEASAQERGFLSNARSCKNLTEEPQSVRDLLKLKQVKNRETSEPRENAMRAYPCSLPPSKGFVLNSIPRPIMSFHPENPEGSMIKEILLKQRGMNADTSVPAMDNFNTRVAPKLMNPVSVPMGLSELGGYQGPGILREHLLKLQELTPPSEFHTLEASDLKETRGHSFSWNISPVHVVSQPGTIPQSNLIDLSLKSKLHQSEATNPSPPPKKRRLNSEPVSDSSVPVLAKPLMPVQPTPTRPSALSMYGGEVQIMDESEAKTLKIVSHMPLSHGSYTTSSAAVAILPSCATSVSVLMTVAQSGLHSGGTMMQVGENTGAGSPLKVPHSQLLGSQNATRTTPVYSQPISVPGIQTFSPSSRLQRTSPSEQCTPLNLVKSQTVRNLPPHVPGIPGPFSNFDQQPVDFSKPVTLTNQPLDGILTHSRCSEPPEISKHISISKVKSSPEPEVSCATHQLARPNSLPTKPRQSLKPKPLISSPISLKSPETPRPKRSYGQLYLNGHAYTYLGLKCSTRLHHCTFKLQPIYALLENMETGLSMYSVWKQPEPNGNELPPGEAMASYDSRHRPCSYTVACSKELGALIVTDSKDWKKGPIKKKETELGKPSSSLSTASPSSSSSDATIGETNLDTSGKECLSLSGSRGEDPLRKKSRGLGGGFKSMDNYTYVRGRGRGNYICEECGIRCKKPSMLKKHIRTHTDLRPFVCPHCNFSFKTKGNLTKHMKSKAHHKKCLELGISPVPTTIEDSQIDISALATQERLSKLELGLEDCDESDIDDEEDDDEEMEEEEEEEEEDEEDEEEELEEEEEEEFQGRPEQFEDAIEQYSIRMKHEPGEDLASGTATTSQEHEAAESLLSLCNAPSSIRTYIATLSAQNEREKLSQNAAAAHLPSSKSKYVHLSGGPQTGATRYYFPSSKEGEELPAASSSSSSPPVSKPDSCGSQKVLRPTTLNLSSDVPLRQPVNILQSPCTPIKGLDLLTSAVSDAPTMLSSIYNTVHDGKQTGRVSPDPMEISVSGDMLNQYLKEKAQQENARKRAHQTQDTNAPTTLNLVSPLAPPTCSSVTVMTPHSPQTLEMDDSSSAEPLKLPLKEEAVTPSEASTSDDSACLPIAVRDDIIKPSGSGNKGPTYGRISRDEDRCVCSVCSKVFSKPSQLRIHVNIHYFERPFRCDACSISFRTKGHLQKHKRSVSHFNKVNMNMAFGTPTTDNPRPFKCIDCKVAFRIHGHLAKHLRSKMHIMKLECLGKLPFGTYAEMERSGFNLNEIDTTDCENSLESLQSLAQRLHGKDVEVMKRQRSISEGAVDPKVEPLNGDVVLPKYEDISDPEEDKHSSSKG